jgi:dihydrodipicolinate synthase/N-acetylneuraminate lyase
MALPVVPLPKGSVEIAGQTVEYRSLSRDEVARLSALTEDVNEAEVFTIAAATGVTTDEATEWRKSVSAATASMLLKAIAETSGLRPVRNTAGN